MVVQKLYETCKEVFAKGEANFAPPPADIRRLQLVLDNMVPEDVCVTRNMPYFEGNEDPRCVKYVHIHECDNFSIGIFCLPASGVIPLHNHPGMTVISKLLFGSMHIKSYDWENQNVAHVTCLAGQRCGARLAKVHLDSDFMAPCNTSVLYPAASGNMHRFTALTKCAVLDVLGPPYSEVQGRNCAYYRDHPCARSSDSGEEQFLREYAWLEEIEKPDHFGVVEAPYKGPSIVEQ